MAGLRRCTYWCRFHLIPSVIILGAALGLWTSASEPGVAILAHQLRFRTLVNDV